MDNIPAEQMREGVTLAAARAKTVPDLSLADAVDAAFDAYVRDRPQPYVGTTERSAYDRIKRQHEWIVGSGLCKCHGIGFMPEGGSSYLAR